MPKKKHHTIEEYFDDYCQTMLETISRIKNATPEQHQLIQNELELITLLESLRTCDARTRDGGLCRRRPMSGKRRCKLHGGASTGATTEEALGLKIADGALRL
jgi:hypothetical protein